MRLSETRIDARGLCHLDVLYGEAVGGMPQILFVGPRISA